MKQKKSALVCCLCALLICAPVLALNLGDVDLKSAADEPLEASITLSDVSAEEWSNLSIGLADVAGFRWAGIEWSPLLNQLQFELRRGADGVDYVRIYSAEPVRADVLHFLLKAAWPGGRLFREYALEIGGPAQVSGETPAPVAATAAEGDWDEVRAAVSATRNYNVVRDDTLWEIARALRPDASVSVQQMMLALLRANPDAFSYGNINWLKAGATLWMPGDFEIQALSRAKAFGEVLAQNNVWREARGLPTVDSGWLAGVGPIAADGELRLVAVDAGDLEADRAALRPDPATPEQELALANERVEELSQENTELENELSEAETIIGDLKRLVELKDDELAALQTRTLTEQAEPGASLTERIGALYDSAAESVSGAQPSALYDTLKEYWLLALGVLGLLLALIVWALPRNRTAPEQGAIDGVSDRSDTADGAEDISQSAPGQEQETADEEPDTDAGSEADSEPASEEPEPEDEIRNKIDLARAYLELGAVENVHSVLQEVLLEGNEAQQEEARQLLEQAESE